MLDWWYELATTLMATACFGLPSMSSQREKQAFTSKVSNLSSVYNRS